MLLLFIVYFPILYALPPNIFPLEPASNLILSELEALDSMLEEPSAPFFDSLWERTKAAVRFPSDTYQFISACREGNLDSVRSLLESESRYGLEESEVTPFQIPQSSNESDQDFMTGDGEVESRSVFSSFSSWTSSVDSGSSLLQARRNEVDVNFPFKLPLSLAIQSGNTDLVRYLLGKGAELSQTMVEKCFQLKEMVTLVIREWVEKGYSPKLVPELQVAVEMWNGRRVRRSIFSNTTMKVLWKSVLIRAMILSCTYKNAHIQALSVAQLPDDFNIWSNLALDAIETNDLRLMRVILPRLESGVQQKHCPDFDPIFNHALGLKRLKILAFLFQTLPFHCIPLGDIITKSLDITKVNPIEKCFVVVPVLKMVLQYLEPHLSQFDKTSLSNFVTRFARQHRHSSNCVPDDDCCICLDSLKSPPCLSPCPSSASFASDHSQPTNASKKLLHKSPKRCVILEPCPTHFFHATCLRTYLSSTPSKSCPLCRRAIVVPDPCDGVYPWPRPPRRNPLSHVDSIWMEEPWWWSLKL